MPSGRLRRTFRGPPTLGCHEKSAVGEMPDLIAIAYAEETVAGQAAEELDRRADDLSVDPDAIGVIVCERDGSFQLITSRHPGGTASWSRFWGMLLGAVMGEVEISGFDQVFRERIRGMLSPGTSVLFAVIGGMRPERAREALSQYGGTALGCPLARDGMAELWEALNGENAPV
jgi:uncharacterized membrane protein